MLKTSRQYNDASTSCQSCCLSSFVYATIIKWENGGTYKKWIKPCESRKILLPGKFMKIISQNRLILQTSKKKEEEKPGTTAEGIVWTV